MTGAAVRDGASERMRLYGTVEPPAEFRVLRAGPLSAELEDGQLRYVRFGGVEIVRAIAFVVRDTGWGTATPEIAELSVEEDRDGFRVSYRAACRTADGSLRYAARIEADANTLRFSAEGAAEGDFATNRTGFVVLHPLEGVAGAALAVTHTDGRVTDIGFPELVEPWQPATDIRALRHEPAPGLVVAIRFEGDAFEMEDHRNWGDASFKTYVRPLARGFPYTLPAGERFAQSVEVAVEGHAPSPPVRVTVGPRAGAMPVMRLAVDPESADEALAVARTLLALHVPRLNARFDTRRHGAADAARLAELCGAVGADVSLEAVVPGREPQAELDALARTVAASGLRVAELLVVPARDLRSRSTGLPPGEASLKALADAARAAFPGARIGGGSLAYFTELNRNRPPRRFDDHAITGFDFVSHGFAANIHAADDRSVMETLQTVPHIARNVRGLLPEMSYQIGFAAIAMRESPYGAGPVPNPHGRRLAATRDDPRHRAPFGAAWGLGFAARAAAAGVEAMALATPTGAFGVVEAAPEGTAGRLTPLGAVIQGLAMEAGSPRRFTVSDDAEVAAFAHEADRGVALWLANLSARPRSVAFSGFRPGGVRWFDEATIAVATGAPGDFIGTERPFSGPLLTLPPYAVARLGGFDAP